MKSMMTMVVWFWDVLLAQDIAIRVIAEGLRPEQTLASRIMTRNPVFVSSGTLAIEALQKMVQGYCFPPFREAIIFYILVFVYFINAVLDVSSIYSFLP